MWCWGWRVSDLGSRMRTAGLDSENKGQGFARSEVCGSRGSWCQGTPLPWGKEGKRKRLTMLCIARRMEA